MKTSLDIAQELILKHALKKQQELESIKPVYRRLQQLQELLLIFNIKTKIDTGSENSEHNQTYAMLQCNVERFAEAVPVMELLEKEFGECKHLHDIESSKLRIFAFGKGELVKLWLYAGEGCQKVEVKTESTEYKLMCN